MGKVKVGSFSPVLLGEGEPLFAGLNFSKLGFVPAKTVHGEKATHVFLQKRTA